MTILVLIMLVLFPVIPLLFFIGFHLLALHLSALFCGKGNEYSTSLGFLRKLDDL